MAEFGQMTPSPWKKGVDGALIRIETAREMRLLERYPLILLDMCGTFMFGMDRFGAEEDFHATYRAFGGVRLDEAAVTLAIRACYQGMARDHESPECVDDFPSVVEGLRRYAAVSEEDVPHLEAVFTAHEVGEVPPAFAALLQRLGRTHQLGLVSNIWGPKAPWLAELARAGVTDAFRVMVFSSDSRSIKPSPALFRKALNAFPGGSPLLFVGDSLRCDIAPAKALGMATAWITPEGSSPLADHVLPDALALEWG